MARLNGVPLETVDVDVVPDRLDDNHDRLVEALNLLWPRWRAEGIPEGLKIAGGLEARHFWGGFEDGYTVLIAGSTRVCRGDVEIRVGALVDLIRKEQLRRAKHIEHLTLLHAQFPELVTGSRGRPADAP